MRLVMVLCVIVTGDTLALNVISNVPSAMMDWCALALESVRLASWARQAVSVGRSGVERRVSCNVQRILLATCVLEMVLVWSQQAKQRALVKTDSLEIDASTSVLAWWQDEFVLDMANAKFIQMSMEWIKPSVCAILLMVEKIACCLVRSTTRGTLAMVMASVKVMGSVAVTTDSLERRVNLNALTRTSKCVHPMENASLLQQKEKKDLLQLSVNATEVSWDQNATLNAPKTLKVLCVLVGANVKSMVGMLFASVTPVLVETTANSSAQVPSPVIMYARAMVNAMLTQQTLQLQPSALRVTKVMLVLTALYDAPTLIRRDVLAVATANVWKLVARLPASVKKASLEMAVSLTVPETELAGHVPHQVNARLWATRHNATVKKAF